MGPMQRLFGDWCDASFSRGPSGQSDGSDSLNDGFGGAITEDGMKLTDAQNEKLEWLHKQGGSGYLDKHGRMVAGGDHMPQGCWPAWLNLVAHGLIAGGDGRLTITDYGRRHMAPSGATE